MKTEETSRSLTENLAEVRDAVTQMILDNPIAALGVAAGVGYVLGGGLRSRLGRALIFFAGRRIGQGLLADLLVTTIDGFDGRNNQASTGTRRRGDGPSGQPVRDQSAGRSGRRQAAN